jgi:uncharacterized membrane protein
MACYETSVDISAPVETIWTVTCDLDSWPQWSPTMDSVQREDSGPLQPGSRARVEQPRLRPATWVVDELVDGTKFSWHTDGVGYRVRADHVFQPYQDGTRATLQVVMTGALAPLLWALTGRTARRYLDQEAAALKQRCESGGEPGGSSA